MGGGGRGGAAAAVQPPRQHLPRGAGGGRDGAAAARARHRRPLQEDHRDVPLSGSGDLRSSITSQQR